MPAPTPSPLKSVHMTFHPGDRAHELLARSHHHYSHYSHYSTGHSSSGISSGGWWMIVVGVVIGVGWVVVKRRLRTG